MSKSQKTSKTVKTSKSVKVAQPKAAKSAENKASGPAEVRKDAVITVVAKENPFRSKGSAGGRAYNTFSVLKSGMKISDAVKKGALRFLITHAANKGFIKLKPIAA